MIGVPNLDDNYIMGVVRVSIGLEDEMLNFARRSSKYFHCINVMPVVLALVLSPKKYDNIPRSRHF